MRTEIRHIALEKLVAHPDNPNRMSRANLDKLVRNIERTGCYEPLVVRACPGRPGFFQIINGHHRCEALRRLGHKTIDVVVWNISDSDTDILLATLNRLTGRDTLEKRLAVLRRLHAEMPTFKLAKLLPQTRGQLDRLMHTRPPVRTAGDKATPFATPMVFFVDGAQQRTIEDALTAASGADASTRAARRAAALARLAGRFLEQKANETPRG